MLFTLCLLGFLYSTLPQLLNIDAALGILLYGLDVISIRLQKPEYTVCSILGKDSNCNTSISTFLYLNFQTPSQFCRHGLLAGLGTLVRPATLFENLAYLNCQVKDYR